jgi:hydrogenase maturation protein HypF
VGRFFDGIAALLGLYHAVSFEGQAAMALEMIADKNVQEAYFFEWLGADARQLPVAPIVHAVVEDLRGGVDFGVISAKFHNTIIAVFADICKILRKIHGLNQVALSGGVFQNAIISAGLIQSLAAEGFATITHTKVPANDGGAFSGTGCGCLSHGLRAPAINVLDHPDLFFQRPSGHWQKI